MSSGSESVTCEEMDGVFKLACRLPGFTFNSSELSTFWDFCLWASDVTDSLRSEVGI